MPTFPHEAPRSLPRGLPRLTQGLVADFCEQVLVHDLPALPPDRRDATVAFATRRIAGLPSPMRVAVGVVSIVVGGLGRVVGTARLVALLAAHPLPVAGEYVRLARSLTYAYVWETWPDTDRVGAPMEVA